VDLQRDQAGQSGRLLIQMRSDLYASTRVHAATAVSFSGMTLHDVMRWLHRQFIPCARSCSKVAALYDSAQLEGGGSGSLLNPGERAKK
jgi:hypothetical protein